jgi:hypothetical protein
VASSKQDPEPYVRRRPDFLPITLRPVTDRYAKVVEASNASAGTSTGRVAVRSTSSADHARRLFSIGEPGPRPRRRGRPQVQRTYANLLGVRALHGRAISGSRATTGWVDQVALAPAHRRGAKHQAMFRRLEAMAAGRRRDEFLAQPDDIAASVLAKLLPCSPTPIAEVWQAHYRAD